MKKYTEQMMFKCSIEEREQIKRTAEKLGMTISEYIRSMVLALKPPKRKPNKPKE